jgi:hypothetical protein
MAWESHRGSSDPRCSSPVERAHERLGDVLEVLEDEGCIVRRMGLRCPFHQDSEPSAGIYHGSNGLRFHCFVCEFDFDAIGLKAEFEGISEREVIARYGR